MPDYLVPNQASWVLEFSEIYQAEKRFGIKSLQKLLSAQIREFEDAPFAAPPQIYGFSGLDRTGVMHS